MGSNRRSHTDSSTRPDAEKTLPPRPTSSPSRRNAADARRFHESANSPDPETRWFEPYRPAGRTVPTATAERYPQPQSTGYPNLYQQGIRDPYQPAAPEPLFVGINPYDAPGRWRQRARPAPTTDTFENPEISSVRPQTNAAAPLRPYPGQPEWDGWNGPDGPAYHFVPRGEAPILPDVRYYSAPAPAVQQVPVIPPWYPSTPIPGQVPYAGGMMGTWTPNPLPGAPPIIISQRPQSRGRRSRSPRRSPTLLRPVPNSAGSLDLYPILPPHGQSSSSRSRHSRSHVSVNASVVASSVSGSHHSEPPEKLSSRSRSRSPTRVVAEARLSRSRSHSSRRHRSRSPDSRRFRMRHRSSMHESRSRSRSHSPAHAAMGRHQSRSRSHLPYMPPHFGAPYAVVPPSVPSMLPQQFPYSPPGYHPAQAKHEDSSYNVSSVASSGLPPPATSSRSGSSFVRTLQTICLVVFYFIFDYIPRQLYLHLLLRIPSLYFSRVTRIFEDARLSLPDIKRMARARAEQWNPAENPQWPSLMFGQTPDHTALPRSLLHFRSSWENFIDSLMREWKTLNIISVLLMSAILTMLQIDAAAHPITRTSALFSLICSLMSLLYGCMYIIRFGTMRKMHKASSFANEAQKGTTSIWWNVWVLLAMPAIWLSWSIITFLVCIMSFIWLSGSSADPIDFIISPHAALGPRIGLTVVFSLGILYFILIVREFHRYGDPLDREWMRTVNEWSREFAYVPVKPPSRRSPTPRNAFDQKVHIAATPPITRSKSPSRSHTPEIHRPSIQVEIPLSFLAGGFTRLQPSSPLTTHPSAFFKDTPESRAALVKPDSPVEVMRLGYPDVEARKYAYADPMWAHAIEADDWGRFTLDISSAWNGQLALMPPETAASDLDLPIYALQRPDRPDNPMPTSAESDGRFGANPVQNRSLGSSESSSYGRVKPSKYANAGFTAPENSNTEEHEQNASASVKKNSLSPTPSPDDGVEPSTSQITAEDSVQIVRDFISLWNKRYFHPRNIEAILVPLPNSSGPEFAVNLAMRFPWAPTHPDSEPLYGIPPDTNTSRLPVETASEIGPSGSFTTADDSPNSPSATHVPDRRSTQS